jgi:hypothetical protein
VQRDQRLERLAGDERLGHPHEDILDLGGAGGAQGRHGRARGRQCARPPLGEDSDYRDGKQGSDLEQQGGPGHVRGEYTRNEPAAQKTWPTGQPTTA